MVYFTKQFKLMGTTITVTETYEGEFEEQRKIVEENNSLLIKSRDVDKIIINPLPQAELQPEQNPMLPEIMAMGGVLLTKKTLKNADISQSQNRLQVKITDQLLNLLTDEEKAMILNQEGGIRVATIDPRMILNQEGGIRVATIDPRAQTYNMKLKMWKSMQARKKLVLISEWGKLAEDNRLKVGDFVELWGVRVNDTLRFAVNIKK